MNQDTGYLIIAHGALAQELLNSLEFIAGAQPNFKAIAIDHAVDVDHARELVLEAVNEIVGENGAIVFTDLFGGAPSNIALSLLGEQPIEIVAGINMPILLHAATSDDTSPLKEKAAALRDYGKNNIFVASEVLLGKKK